MTIPVKVSNVAEGAVAALSQAVRTFLFENSPKVDLSKGHRAAVLHLGEIDDLSSAPAGLTTRLETADAYLFPLLSTDAPEGEGDIVGYVEVRGTDNPVARVGDGLYENRVSEARKLADSEVYSTIEVPELSALGVAFLDGDRCKIVDTGATDFRVEPAAAVLERWQAAGAAHREAWARLSASNSTSLAEARAHEDEAPTQQRRGMGAGG